MKKIEAIIRSSKFEDVKEALQEIEVYFFTFLEVKGHGLEKIEEFTYRGVPYDSGYIPRLKLEVVVADDKLEAVVNTILIAAKTGSIGDGKIIVTPVEAFIRIRTGEENLAAI